MKITRQVRAIGRIAVTWGVAFSALAVAAVGIGLAFRALPPDFRHVGLVAIVMTRAFVAGAVSGTLFATLFARAERNRTLASLSARRVALWGFIGASAPAAITLGLGAARIIPVGVMGAACIAYGLIGATLGTVMVKVARRAPAGPVEAIPS
jgi:hypothetical protein